MTKSKTYKGALQLLFDVRLLLLIVRPSWEGSELENLLEKQGQTIVRALQDRVDPIDLAVSEPPLNQNIDRYYQRSYVLLGLLLPLHSRPQENRKLRGSDQPNILAMSSKTKVRSFSCCLLILPPTEIHSLAHQRRDSVLHTCSRTGPHLGSCGQHRWYIYIYIYVFCNSPEI